MSGQLILATLASYLDGEGKPAAVTDGLDNRPGDFPLVGPENHAGPPFAGGMERTTYASIILYV